VRNIESANAKLEKTLYQAEKDNSKLVVELKDTNDSIKKAENKLKGVSSSIAELGITYKNLEQQTSKTRSELDRHTVIY
jgi:archaellum component FlaC